MRYVRYSPALRAVLARSFTFALGTSVLWAALPLGKLCISASVRV
jgi:hypothetical protein